MSLLNQVINLDLYFIKSETCRLSERKIRQSTSKGTTMLAVKNNEGLSPKYRRAKFGLTTTTIGLLFSVVCLAEQLDINKQAWPEEALAPTTKQVLELVVTLDDRVEVGESDGGIRRFIPITGGYFRGHHINGKVLRGGADWQLQRPDGVLEIDALYAVETDDGAHIIIHNQGIVVRPTEQNSQSVYIKTTPQFHAPTGKYDWLNKHVFTGSITPVENGKAVIIRVFQID